MNNKYLDFTSGIGTLSTGHSHPYIISKVTEQLPKIIHCQQQIFKSHPPQIELVEKMLTILPKDLDKLFFTNSGSEAIDNAIKIARKYTNKNNIIAMNGGFHGRTIAALSITSSNLFCKQNTHPLSGIFFCSDFNKDSIDKIFLNQSSPQDTAAIILEPVLGEGGIFSIPEDFIKYLRLICDDHNILLIADEIQCGSGRTGTFWNIEQKDTIPDILTFAKGIASGFPLAGLASRSNFMDDIGRSYLGGTYGGNALCSVAASATIDVISSENLIDNSINMGNFFRNCLLTLPGIKSIRQYGLMIAIEPNPPYSSMEIVNKLRDLNMLVLLCGNQNQYIRILPPLNVSLKEIEIFMDNLKKCF